jgi:hypothetical protein
MLEFIMKNWFSIISTILLTAGFLYSNSNARNALKKSEKTISIAEEALDKTKSHFFETNRPILIAGPVNFQDGNYFSLQELGQNKIRITILVSISNKGNIIASKTNIEEADLMIAARGKKISRKRNYYDNLGNQVETKEQAVKSNFTLMDVPPGATFVKELTFALSLDDTEYNFGSISELQNKNEFIVNVNLRVTCGYEQIEDKEFITHTTHAITKHGISTLETRLGAYEKAKSN